MLDVQSLVGGLRTLCALRTFSPFHIIDQLWRMSIIVTDTPPCRAGPAEKPSDKYYKAAQLADALGRELHYTVDEKQKAVLITDDGYEAAEDVLEVSSPKQIFQKDLSISKYTRGLRRGWTHTEHRTFAPDHVHAC